MVRRRKLAVQCVLIDMAAAISCRAADVCSTIIKWWVALAGVQSRLQLCAECFIHFPFNFVPRFCNRGYFFPLLSDIFVQREFSSPFLKSSCQRVLCRPDKNMKVKENTYEWETCP